MVLFAKCWATNGKYRRSRRHFQLMFNVYNRFKIKLMFKYFVYLRNGVYDFDAIWIWGYMQQVLHDYRNIWEMHHWTVEYMNLMPCGYIDIWQYYYMSIEVTQYIYIHSYVPICKRRVMSIRWYDDIKISIWVCCYINIRIYDNIVTWI